MNKKILILALATLTLAGTAFYGVSRAYADNWQEQYPPIVQKLVDKFGLKEEDVKAVFDEARQEKQSRMQAKFEERLNTAVSDGKITDGQKQLILNKHQELMTNRQKNFEDWHNMSADERRAAMQKQKQELETWASQNGIDLQYLFGGHMGRFNGIKGHWGYK